MQQRKHADGYRVFQDAIVWEKEAAQKSTTFMCSAVWLLH